MSEPWQDYVDEMFSDLGIEATDEQRRELAEGIPLLVDYMRAPIAGPSPEQTEIKQLQKALDQERSKVTCRECNGRGINEEPFGPIGRVSISQCWKCRGEGRHLP